MYEYMLSGKTPIVGDKAILVGRHTNTHDMGFEIIDQKNILWSTDVNQCMTQLKQLIKEAQAANVSVLLQNTPAILSVAIARLMPENPNDWPPLGVIVSVVFERKSNQVGKFNFIEYDDVLTATEAVKSANSRAKIETEGFSVTITVDPVPEFSFSHIEWFNRFDPPNLELHG